MSAPESTAVITPPPAPAPSSPPATVDHVNALAKRLDQLEQLVVSGFEKVVGFVSKAAPVVETAAAAAAGAIPGVAPVAAAVAKVVGVVETAVNRVLDCCGHNQSQHYPSGLCAQPGCSCKGPG